MFWQLLLSSHTALPAHHTVQSSTDIRTLHSSSRSSCYCLSSGTITPLGPDEVNASFSEFQVTLGGHPVPPVSLSLICMCLQSSYLEAFKGGDLHLWWSSSYFPALSTVGTDWALMHGVYMCCGWLESGVQLSIFLCKKGVSSLILRLFPDLYRVSNG